MTVRRIRAILRNENVPVNVKNKVILIEDSAGLLNAVITVRKNGYRINNAPKIKTNEDSAFNTLLDKPFSILFTDLLIIC